MEAQAANILELLNLQCKDLTEKECLKEDIEKIFDFLNEEIEIRIESIKIDFDVLLEKLLNNLNERKTNSVIQTSKINETMNKFRNKERKNIKKLQKVIKNYNKRLYNYISFKKQQSILNKSCIGTFKGPDILDIDLIKRTSPNIHNYRGILANTNDFCEFNQNELLVVDSLNNRICVINVNFEIINQLDNINGVKFRNPTAICTNLHRFYLCNRGSNQVFVINSTLTKIVHVIEGRKNCNCAKLRVFEDICYFKNQLYVVDRCRCKQFASVFSENGEFIKEIIPIEVNRNNYGSRKTSLEYPVRIGVSNDIIAISDHFLDIFIYDLNGRLLKVLESKSLDRVFCFNTNYLLTCNTIGHIVCYEIEGLHDTSNMNFKIIFERRIESLVGVVSFMKYINTHLIITFSNKKFVVTI